MLTVELLDQALDAVRRAGYKIRQEWLDGCNPGACVLKGQKWLFLDPSASPREQLEEVLAVLASDPQVGTIELAPGLEQVLRLRAA